MLAGGKHYGGNNGRTGFLSHVPGDPQQERSLQRGYGTYPSTVSATFQGTELIGADFVSFGNYFPVLGTPGAAARVVFTASDDSIQVAAKLAVLSYGYWRSRFGSIAASWQIVINAAADDYRRQPGRLRWRWGPGRAPQVRIPVTMIDQLLHIGISGYPEHPTGSDGPKSSASSQAGHHYAEGSGRVTAALPSDPQSGSHRTSPSPRPRRSSSR